MSRTNVKYADEPRLAAVKSAPLSYMKRMIVFIAMSSAMLLAGRTLAQPSPQADPKPTDHRAEAAFRRLQLQDENGNIPADGITKAMQQKQAMTVNASVWLGANPPKPTGIHPLVRSEESRGGK